MRKTISLNSLEIEQLVTSINKQGTVDCDENSRIATSAIPISGILASNIIDTNKETSIV